MGTGIPAGPNNGRKTKTKILQIDRVHFEGLGSGLATLTLRAENSIFGRSGSLDFEQLGHSLRDGDASGSHSLENPTARNL
jgi:hypothetical protein